MKNILTETKEINGKKLGKSQLNLLTKLAKLGVIPAQEKAVRVNPYSGIRCELDPLAVTLHDFIINSYHAGFVGRVFPVSIWDSARHLFLAIWPDEYFKLID